MNEDKMFQLSIAVVLLATAAVALLCWLNQPDIPTPSAELMDTAPAVEEILRSSSLDLNTATAAQLEELPGIGQVLSQRIVDYRKSLGAFAQKEQLMEVEGIGQATYDKISHLVYVEPPK